MNNKEKRKAKLDRRAKILAAREKNEPKKIRVKKNKPTPKNPLTQAQVVKLEKNMERAKHNKKVAFIKEAK